MTTEDEQANSGIFRKEFGDNWRWWRWLQRQFTATSLGVIGLIVTVAGTYIVRMNQKVAEQGTRIVVLETRVVPVLEERKQESTNRVEIEDLKARISRLEANYDIAQREAGTPPVSFRRRTR